MTGAGEKGKWFRKIGAGSWALMGALALLCLIVFSGKREADAPGTELEQRMAHVIEKMEGVEDADVMIVEDGDAITGVLIVVDGAEDLSVRLRIQNAVGTLLQIENSKIGVVPMEGNEK